jgi:hypothetical protein
MKVLWHLTWDCNIPSILKLGLIPSFLPNKWQIDSANQRSKGKLFLCKGSKKSFWQMTYNDGWVVHPTKPHAAPAWLKVNVSGLKLVADDSDDDQLKGDFYTTQAIPPDRIDLQRFVIEARYPDAPDDMVFAFSRTWQTYRRYWKKRQMEKVFRKMQKVAQDPETTYIVARPEYRMREDAPVCKHNHTHSGPRTAALYGTFPTLICDDCGRWCVAAGRKKWRTDDMNEYIRNTRPLADDLAADEEY